MKRWLNNLLMGVFGAIFLISGFFLIRHYLNIQENKQTYDTLASMVEQARPEPTEGKQQIPEQTQIQETQQPSEEPEILPEYREAYALNDDLVGWLRIDGTNINYPVMQSPEEPDYYLYRDFYKNSSKGGCLYAQAECDITSPSDNITIYGHNTRGGAIMFNALNGYTRKSFWEDHRFIQFDTLTEHHTYEIIAVFKTSANLNQGFSYHKFVNANSEIEFDEFINTCKELAFYDTGVTATYGDKLITLSTCEYTLSNGRLAVLAKRIEE